MSRWSLINIPSCPGVPILRLWRVTLTCETARAFLPCPRLLSSVLWRSDVGPPACDHGCWRGRDKIKVQNFSKLYKLWLSYHAFSLRLTFIRCDVKSYEYEKWLTNVPVFSPIMLLYIARGQETCKIDWMMFIHPLTWCQAFHLHLTEIIKSNLDKINHKIYRLVWPKH